MLYQGAERSWSAFKTVHEGAIGERISIYRHEGSDWRKLSQKTSIGGYDWFVPIMVGMISRDPFNSFRPQDNVGFVRLNGVEPERLDPDLTLSLWGLGMQATPLDDQSLSALARRLLADGSIPHASAAMQFLAAYPWLGGWRKDDFETIAAIIRDRRVTEFPPLWGREPTPIVLAQPIIDRISATDLSPQNSDHRGNFSVVEILSEAFGRLPPCTAAPFHEDLQRLADDNERRPFLTPMLRRLADADPGCDAKTSR